MRGELPNLLNFSFQHFGHVSVSAFSFLICRKLFPNLRTAGHDSCPGVKCGFAPSPPLGETQEVSKLNNSYWVQPPKISVPGSGSMDSIKGTFLCVFPRELVGMQAECVAAYVRLTRIPHRDHSPHQPQLTSFIGVHFLGKRRQKCPLPFKSAPAITHCYCE